MAKKVDIYLPDQKRLRALHGFPGGMVEETTPLIIMVHGFPGHKSSQSDLYGDLEYMLVEKGHHTLRFDFRGCGQSDGKEQEFTIATAHEDFLSAVRWGREMGYKNFIFIAEGLGATIATMKLPRSTSALILLWPLFDHLAYYKAHFADLSLGSEVKKNNYLEHGGHQWGFELIKEFKSFDSVPHLEMIAAPTLILHGALDQKIPIEQLDLVRSNFKSKRIEITTFQDGEEGLQKLNHRKMMFYHITQFIEKYA